jgi:hypothetical protein
MDSIIRDAAVDCYGRGSKAVSARSITSTTSAVEGAHNMAHGGDPGESSDHGPMDGEWLTDYASRSAAYWQRAARAGSDVAARWGERSLQDGEWTVDTVTADLIEAWEELTPLLGEGLELWLQFVQKSLQTGRPDG